MTKPATHERRRRSPINSHFKAEAAVMWVIACAGLLVGLLAAMLLPHLKQWLH